MNGPERMVNVKDWGYLGAKKGVLYEERGELKFTDGFHDKKMAQARIEAFVPGDDTILAEVYRRMRGTRNWHPVVKELKRLLGEGEKRDMKIEPRKQSDRGGWLCMPLVSSAPEGKEGWEKVQCPVCGELCWKRPEDTGVIHKSKLDGACCTLCALKKGAGRL